MGTAKKHKRRQLAIPINRISDTWIKCYMQHKAKILQLALENGIMPPVCSTRERWHNRKCLDYCNVRVFTQEDGNPIFYDTPSKWFKKFLIRHNLPKITFHQLRHTNATLLVGQGVDVRTVSNRLGHARTSTTTDIYECVKLGLTI